MIKPADRNRIKLELSVKSVVNISAVRSAADGLDEERSVFIYKGMFRRRTITAALKSIEIQNIRLPETIKEKVKANQNCRNCIYKT